MKQLALFAEAYPRKQFFIAMFTRDIALEDCVLDLVDNSVDALIRNQGLDLKSMIRSSRVSKALGSISISLSKYSITVVDDCGGIELEKAKHEVFNFGHSIGGTKDLTANGLGAYGIGLKRAIFKMGDAFVIDSARSGNGFRVQQRISQWVKKEAALEDWRFPIIQLPISKLACRDNGTSITVSDLYPAIQALVSNQSFTDTLARSIARTYSFFLNHSVNVTLNGTRVDPIPVPVGSFQSQEVEFSSEEYRDNGVHVHITAGLAARGPRNEWQSDRAGWYVLCNGRTVVAADKTSLTGWGDGIIPAFHSSKSRGFVGLANFTSDDPLKLPWTTTKRGLNRESPVYLRALNRMQSVARPVFSYLDSLYASSSSAEAEAEREAVKNVQQASDAEILKPRTSVFRPPKRKKPKDRVSVQYQVDREKLDAVREFLGKPKMSAGDVGKYAFDYLVEQEEL